MDDFRIYRGAAGGAGDTLATGNAAPAFAAPATFTATAVIGNKIDLGAEARRQRRDQLLALSLHQQRRTATAPIATSHGTSYSELVARGLEHRHAVLLSRCRRQQRR